MFGPGNYTMAPGHDKLVSWLRAYRSQFDIQYPHLSDIERDQKFRLYWDTVSSEITYTPSAMLTSSNLVPQKRSASQGSNLGMEPHPKRTASASLPDQAPYLQRHTSCPTAFSSSSRRSPLQHTSEPMTKTRPIPIPISSRRSTGYRVSGSNAAHSARSFGSSALPYISEISDLSPTDYLAQTQNSFQATSASMFRTPEYGAGEWSPDMTLLTTNHIEHDGGYSPATATSDSYLTNASTIMSEAMTRNNTTEQVYGSLAMFRMDSNVTNFRDESMSNIPKIPYATSVSSPTVQFPYVSSPISPVAMSPSPSKESGDYPSDCFLSDFPTVKIACETKATTKPRTIAPKRHSELSNQPPVPRIVAVRGEDGTVKHKAEITRTTRQPQQRKTTFCDFCNDQPQGFHGEHELRRHIERQHTQYRKVWVCRDVSENGTFLQNCKACRNNKTYGANYNAAAHLRRTHFNPCKNKRGGRNKKSENRGGMGGGNLPAMEELKKWMYETYEINLNGRVIVQAVAPDVNVPQVPMAELIAYDQNMSADVDYDVDVVPDLNQSEALTLDTTFFQPQYRHDMYYPYNQ